MNGFTKGQLKIWNDLKGDKVDCALEIPSQSEKFVALLQAILGKEFLVHVSALIMNI